MTKGQRVMAVAMIHPVSEQGKKNTSFVTKEVSTAGLSKARTVRAPAWRPRSPASTARHIGDRFKFKMADATRQDTPRSVHQS